MWYVGRRIKEDYLQVGSNICIPMQRDSVAKGRDAGSEGACNTKCMGRPTFKVNTHLIFSVIWYLMSLW